MFAFLKPSSRSGWKGSIFSYNITRPYPYRWFTPVTTIGFIVATVLFSLLNFASNAYTTLSYTTKDPNATLSDYHSMWVSRWPSVVASKLEATCQASGIPVQSDLFTNQTALTYSLASVTGGGTDDSNQTIVPSLSYVNNQIQNCSVRSIMILLESLDRSANQIAYSQWGATVRVFINCAINGGSGPQSINLTTSYDYVPDNVDVRGYEAQGLFLGTNFRSRDQTNRASLWWGESCMSIYWTYLSRSMQDLQLSDAFAENPIRKGILTFTTQYPIPADITSTEFYSVNFRFIVDRGGGSHDTISPANYNHNVSDGVGRLNAAQFFPDIWVQADSLAKVTASTVLTDLGQPNSSFPNIMANPDLLTHYTANFTDMLNHLANAYPGPETQDYATAKDTTGALQVRASVFSRTYICTVPRLKSTASIIISILVADLVFLQTLWLLFKLVVDEYVVPKHPGYNSCEGCLARRPLSQVAEDQDFGNDDEIVLTPVQPLKKSQTSRRSPFHQRESSQYSLLSGK